MMFKRLRTKYCRKKNRLFTRQVKARTRSIFMSLLLFTRRSTYIASSVIFRIFVYLRELTRRQRPEHQVPDEDGPGVEDGDGGGGEPVAP